MRLPRGTIWLVVMVALLAAAPAAANAQVRCGGFLQPPCPPPPPPPLPPPPPPPPPAPELVEVTLSPASATRQARDFNKTVTFRGRISKVPAGGAPVKMQLRMTVPAYDDVTLDAVQFSTEPDGSFSVTVAPPGVSVRVRAEIKRTQQVFGQSPERSVTIRPRLTLDVRPAAGLFTFTAVVDEFLSLEAVRRIRTRAGPARRAYLYADLGRYAYRVGSARLGGMRCLDGSCTRIATGAVADAERVRRASKLVACARGAVFAGVGDQLSARKCGRTRITLG